jgi:hypothetical protein
MFVILIIAMRMPICRQRFAAGFARPALTARLAGIIGHSSMRQAPDWTAGMALVAGTKMDVTRSLLAIAPFRIAMRTMI